jgi:hypothetical protein
MVKKAFYLIFLIMYALRAASQSDTYAIATPNQNNKPWARSFREIHRGEAISIYTGNSFYFQNANGKPVVLIGDYSWDTFSNVNFDYIRMFDSLKSRGLNFARVWLWKLYAWNPADSTINICPYRREGPGMANDGKPKYNLNKYDPAFFDRLKNMCKAAQKRGIYLQLILLDTWMLKHDYLWRLAAFNKDNNVNHVDGDPRHTGTGTDGKHGYCSQGNPHALKYQKAYIRKVVETVNSYDNIFFEIANEDYYNKQWELALCDFIKTIELKMPKQHMTVQRDFPSHHNVVQSWDPETVHKKIIAKHDLKVPLIFDTDWMLNKNSNEVRKAGWSALASGAHFDYMEGDITYLKDSTIGGSGPDLHLQIGYMARFMKAIKPWTLAPVDGLVRNGIAMIMANKSKLFAYLPKGGEITLDISGLKDNIEGEWYDPRSGKYSKKVLLYRNKLAKFDAPDHRDWVLFLKSY